MGWYVVLHSRWAELGKYTATSIFYLWGYDRFYHEAVVRLCPYCVTLLLTEIFFN